MTTMMMMMIMMLMSGVQQEKDTFRERAKAPVPGPATNNRTTREHTFRPGRVAAAGPTQPGSFISSHHTKTLFCQ
jgi:hypothetical protein